MTKTDIDIYIPDDVVEYLMKTPKKGARQAYTRKVNHRDAKKIVHKETRAWQNAGGGALAMSAENWSALRGYNEEYEGHDKEDQEMTKLLQKRMSVERPKDLIVYHMKHASSRKSKSPVQIFQIQCSLTADTAAMLRH